jgi:hypothetical protein
LTCLNVLAFLQDEKIYWTVDYLTTLYELQRLFGVTGYERVVAFVKLKKKKKNLGELRNTVRSLSQDSKCPGGEPKRGPPECNLAISAFECIGRVGVKSRK